MNPVFPLQTSRNPHVCALVQAVHTSGVAVLFFYLLLFYIRSKSDLRHFDLALSTSFGETLDSLVDKSTAGLLLRPAWLFFPFAAIYAYTSFGKNAESGIESVRQYLRLNAILVGGLVLSFLALTAVSAWTARALPHPAYQVGAALLALLLLWHLQGIGTDLLGQSGTATIRGKDFLKSLFREARA